MRFDLIIIFAVVVALSGCAIYPTSRTYFEPNPNDGVLSQSMSCGYHAAKNDSLVRDIEGIKIKVTPIYKEGKELQVVVLFKGQENNIKVTPKLIGLSSSTIEKSIQPTSIKQTDQQPRSNWPYYMKWIYLTYPVLSESLDSISVVFHNGSVILNNESLELEKFRFKKTTKSDIYYASINC